MPQARQRTREAKKILAPMLQESTEEDDPTDEFDGPPVHARSYIALIAEMEPQDEDYDDAGMTALGEYRDHRLRDFQD